jgi:hypothetical protein
MYTDTPLPADEPRNLNPPDGAIIDYYLKSPAQDISLDLLNQRGEVVRRFVKGVNPDPDPRANGNWPDYWIRPSPVLSPEAGLHRFVWDLHMERPRGVSFSFPISAIPGQSVPEPLGPWVLPGTYMVRLTVDGRTYTQRLEVRMDPRVKTPAIDLQAQHALTMRIFAGLGRVADATKRTGELQQAAAAAGNQAREKQLREILGSGGGDAPGLAGVSGALAQLYGQSEEADRAPTSALRAATDAALRELDTLLAKLKSM